jgi:hypothetical protein
MSDLRDAITAGGGAPVRRVEIVAREDAAQHSFEICGRGNDGGERMCRELALTETGLERAVDELVDSASQRSRVDRIFIVTDYRRRSVCDQFDPNTDRGTVVSGGVVSVSCTSRGRDEPLDGFIDTIVEQIDVTTDLVISVLAEDSITLIRRLGPSGDGSEDDPGDDPEDDPGDEGGVVPELLLPGSGARLHAAGYPVPASIAYDFAEVIPVSGANDADSAPVYVPYAVFRY